MSNRMSGEDGAEMVFRSVVSLLGHKVCFTFGCRSVLSASPEQSLWLGSQSNFEVGSSSIQTHPNSFLPTCEAVPTSSCRPHELQSYLPHLRDILRSYRIERKTEETHTESAVRGSDRGEDVPATTLDTTVGDEDCSPKEVRENFFKFKSLSSMCVRGEMAVEAREESLKLTSSTFGEEEGYCQTSSAKDGEVTSAVGANGLERYGGFAGPADDTAVDELLDSLSILFTASASFDSEKSSCHASVSLEFGGACCESLESSSSQPRSQESSLPTCQGAPTSSCHPHELQSYLPHLRDILRSYRIERKTEETHTESTVRGSDRGEDLPATTFDTTLGDENDCTMGDVVMTMQTPERNEEMESLRQALKESEEKCLTLLEEKGSVEKKCAESEEKLANLRTEKSAREEEVQKLTEKNTSLEEEGSRLRKERDDLAGRLSTMERERSAREEEVQKLTKKNTSLEKEGSRLRKERDDLARKLSSMERERSAREEEVQKLTEKNTSLEEEGSRLRKERDDLAGRLSSMERELEEKCLQLLEEKRSAEKKWAEMEGQLASLRTERSAREEEVQKLTEKNTSLEKESSRLRKERDDLARKLSSMERERSAREEEVQKLTEKNTSLEEEGSRLRKESDDLAGKLSSMERELKEKCLQLLEEKRSAEKKWAEMEGQLASLRTERSAREEEVQKLTKKNTSLEEEGSRLRKERDDLASKLSTMKWEEKVRGEQLQLVVERNASLEEDNSKLSRERSDLAGRLSAVEREVQKLTEKNTSLEEDKSTLKRKMDDLARSLSTMENERVILEEDYRALKREKSNEVNYVNQKLAAEEESNRVLLKRISSMDERMAKDL